MKLRNLFIILLFSLSFVACKSSQKTTDKEVNELTYQEIAKEKFGADAKIDYLFNKTKDFVVCTTSNGAFVMKPHNNFNFFIYAIDAKEIIFEDKFTGGNAVWISGTEIKANWLGDKPKVGEITPEITHYIYDVKKRTKTGGKKVETK